MLMEFFKMLSDENFLVWFFVILAILIMVIVKAVVKIVQMSIRERARREIVAYVAEGSMTPEQGEKLIRAWNDEWAKEHAHAAGEDTVIIGAGSAREAMRAAREVQREAQRAARGA